MLHAFSQAYWTVTAFAHAACAAVHDETTCDAGYPIVKGTLTLDVHYIMNNGNLTAENHILLDQLTFGEPLQGFGQAPETQGYAVVFGWGDRRQIIRQPDPAAFGITP